MVSFDEAVEKTATCWLWTRAIGDNGYGKVHVSGRTVYAHRWSYELHVGPIPEGLVIDHLCRVRNCVNPAHLEPVTQHENLRRGATIGYDHPSAPLTTCRRGHDWAETPPRVIHRSDGSVSRNCRVCARAADARKVAKARAQRTPKPPRPRAACGSNAAYQQHYRRGEPIDPLCAAAKAKYVAERRADLLHLLLDTESPCQP